MADGGHSKYFSASRSFTARGKRKRQVKKKNLNLRGFKATRFVSEIDKGTVLTLRGKRDEKELWTITAYGYVLNCHGNWELVDSSLTDEERESYVQRTHFTLQEAIERAREAL